MRLPWWPNDPNDPNTNLERVVWVWCAFWAVAFLFHAVLAVVDLR
jgi:hypothetical protein